MEFRNLQQAVQRKFNEMKGLPLFQANIDKGFIYDLYLDSFPPGTNPKFRERTEHDCAVCRSFIKNAGGMVAYVDGQLTSIWDVTVEEEYQPVVDALADYVKACAIDNVYLYPEPKIGVEKNLELIDGKARQWDHLCITLPNNLVCSKADRGPKGSEFRAQHDVMLRGLMEITPEAIETVRDLIAQDSLYRGAEKKAIVDAFAMMKTRFDKLPPAKRERNGSFTPSREQDYFAWAQVLSPNAWVCKIRNDVVGTLLVDLSEGKDLDAAVKSFEDKVSGTNYKRPTALITPKMKEAAKAKLAELGLMESLDRRYATFRDLDINNVIFADRNATSQMTGDVWDEIPTKGHDPKKLDKVEEIGIEDFLTKVLPTTKSLEVFVENRLSGNLVSLIAPYDLTAKSMFKWDNPFSWSYNGDVADSIKERVKAAGGNVTGELCCRLAWYNHDDLDFHMVEPRNTIYFGAKRSQLTGGQLDVDMNAGGGTTRTPVENIFYNRLSDLKPGRYELKVHQFRRRETTNVGFDVEIDIQGTVHHFTYPNAVKQGEFIVVARINVTDKGVVELMPVLPSTTSGGNGKELWGIQTQNFQSVSAIMLSPNFWGERGVGNKHYFFMLNGCQNDGSARGFYNEFLSNELEPHRKTMEIVGSRMRTEVTEDQMSGLGFSSTQRNSLIVRVSGAFTRILKINF